MMASFGQAGRNERGSASIELAFSLMIFLFMAFGIVEYGTIINERNALTQLAREGASLASRNLTTSANMMDLLESTDNALDFKNQPSKFHIYLAQITAGNNVNPNPTCAVVDRGGLSSGVEPPALPNCDLPQNLFDYLVWNAGTGAAVEQFTVLKVYYEHDPITPVGALSAQFGWGGYPRPTASPCPAQRFFNLQRQEVVHKDFSIPLMLCMCEVNNTRLKRWIVNPSQANPPNR